GSLNRLLAAGSTGYFIIAIDVTATATLANTVKINGAANPLVFGFSTAPNITNNQTDAAGTKTISSTLPVSLVSFTAKAENEKVQLQWKTASEINNAFFDVEHSSDGVNFMAIGRIAGKGTTNLEQSYQFLHETPVNGNNYYQLRQVDIDNRYKYSGIVQVSVKINRIFVTGIYPNPVKNMLQFSVIAPEKTKISIQVNDMAGRMVLQQQQYINNGENKLKLNVSPLTGGIYYLQVTDQTGGKISMYKLVVSNR
ncbi:MAG: T9SS type A sorting domain-containing protein, partial [Ferruginibacter sp.]